MATTKYCTLSKVQDRLSDDGVNLRVDDKPQVAGQVLDEASREIDDYLLLRYSEANLALSPTVAHWCANIAALYLCERRGNPVPPGIAQKYDETVKKLERIAKGGRGLADVPERRANVPVLSNVRVRLDPFPHTVVERNRSGSRNPTPDYVQHADVLEWWNYEY